MIVSAGYLARLPFTPLQYAPLCLDRDRLETIARRIEGACAAAGLEFRLAADFEEYYADQLLALGGHSLAPWLEATAEAGIAHDGGLSRGAAESLEAFAREAGLLGAAFFGEKGEDWSPPLSFIDDNREALRKNYLLASGFAPKEGRFEPPASPGLEWERRLERLMAAKHDFATTLVRVTLPPSLAWATSEYRASWLMRAIASASGEEGASVYDAEEALFSRGGRLEGMAERFCGLAYYRLRGPDARRMAAAARAAGLETIEELPACERIEAVIDLPSARAREAEAALKSWLAEERVDFIETRAAEGRLLRPSARDAKKRILVEALLAGAVPGEEGAFSMRLVLGPKAKLASCLSRLAYADRRAASLRFLDFGL